MHIPRIYYPESLESGSTVFLNEMVSHHLIRVLRLKTGDQLVLFNGKGGEFVAELIEAKKNQAIVRLGSWQKSNSESALKIHLGQAISRNERMDYAIQKSVELGVFEITPLITERSEIKLSQEKALRRQQHWQQIAIHAAEQSGRCEIPAVHLSLTLNEWSIKQKDLRFVCDPHLKKMGSMPLEKPSAVTILVGPPGGFSDGELEFLRVMDFQGLLLGPRILRSETAPVVALSLLQNLWGDLKII